jgi:hypothetical protein
LYYIPLKANIYPSKVIKSGLNKRKKALRPFLPDWFKG